MNRAPTLLALAAMAALIPAQAQAAAAGACITEAELADVIVYATPAVVTGVRGKCARSLAADGFVATKGGAFAAKYAALQPSTWPRAKGALMKVLGAKSAGNARGAEMLAMVASLPDDAVRPLVDGMLSQQIGEMIAIGDCGKAERAMQLSSVMVPRDNAALMAFVLANSGSKDLPMCRTKS